ncbi:MAG: isochorismatase family protein [Phycisphaerae bacterium]|nr:isochorismatase family protein [Phycisphaerae bacterium]
MSSRLSPPLMPPLASPLTPENAVLLIIDLQERLLPAMADSAACVAAAGRLIEAAKILNVPMVCTEQVPLKIGRTVPDIRDRLSDGIGERLGGVPAFGKTRFSVCIEPVTARLRELDRPLIIVVGIEAHVCVQQSVLGLLRLGYLPIVCADAIASRRPLDRDVAIERMRQAGAIITTSESTIFELIGDASRAEFPAILKIVK